jgi:flagellar FliL protein
MADKETESDDKQQEGKKKSSISIFQIIIIILLLAVLGLGGFIAWKLINLDIPVVQTEQQQAPEDKQEAGPGILIDMENITVNLADEDESRFLRVKMKLEVENEEAKTKVDSYSVQIKDLIITILSSKRFDDVRTPQGKYNLKEELAYRINSLVGEELVRNMFFSDFVAQ